MKVPTVGWLLGVVSTGTQLAGARLTCRFLDVSNDHMPKDALTLPNTGYQQCQLPSSHHKYIPARKSDQRALFRGSS